MGLLPWQWARLQPVEIFGLEAAAAWRRNREIEQLAVAAVLLPSANPFGGDGKGPTFVQIRDAMGWDPDVEG